MDVSTWLRDLGLEDYVQAFQANHIDAEVLPRLTADDLTALGITSVGTAAGSSTPSPRSTREEPQLPRRRSAWWRGRSRPNAAS
jgi:SAM domain (Sterile alpha motif)